MRLFVVGLGLSLLLPVFGSSDEPAAPPNYDELSRVIQQAVVKQLPPFFEKRNAWGETIPVPPNLPLPRLRTYVRVGDHYEVPQGAWRRVKGWLDDPKKDLQVHVRDFQQVEATKYRLTLDVDTTIVCEGEWQQWQKGLLLVAANAEANAALRLSLVCDCAVSFEFAKFPPVVKLDPKVKELHVDLKNLTLRHLGTRLVRAEKVKGLDDRLEELLREALKQSEPLLLARANDAIARGLAEGDIPPAAFIKAASKLPLKKKN
jgi:hypothetical protein